MCIRDSCIGLYTTVIFYYKSDSYSTVGLNATVKIVFYVNVFNVKLITDINKFTLNVQTADGITCMLLKNCVYAHACVREKPLQVYSSFQYLHLQYLYRLLHNFWNPTLRTSFMEELQTPKNQVHWKFKVKHFELWRSVFNLTLPISRTWRDGLNFVIGLHHCRRVLYFRSSVNLKYYCIDVSNGLLIAWCLTKKLADKKGIISICLWKYRLSTTRDGQWTCPLQSQCV